MLRLNAKERRVSVREPRAVDHVTMIQNLAHMNAIKVTIDWKKLRKSLGQIENARDRLAHGIWLKHKTLKEPTLQVIKGSYPPTPGAKTIKARIEPQAMPVPLSDLRTITHNIGVVTVVIENLGQQISGQLPP